MVLSPLWQLTSSQQNANLDVQKNTSVMWIGLSNALRSMQKSSTVITPIPG